MNIKYKINSICVLNNKKDVCILDELSITLTDNEVLGSFKTRHNSENGKYTLYSRIVTDSLSHVDVLNIDVLVDFDSGTFKAVRDKDFIFSFNIDGEQYKLDMTEVLGHEARNNMDAFEIDDKKLNSNIDQLSKDLASYYGISVKEAICRLKHGAPSEDKKEVNSQFVNSYRNITI